MPGLQEWLVIAVVALLVVGPERLPKLARSAGELLARVRAVTQQSVGELRRVAEIQELEAELDGLRRELRGAGRDVSERVRASLADADPRVPSRSAPPRAAAASAPPFDPEAT